MKNKIARDIFENTPQEIKDEVTLAAHELIASANRVHEENFTVREYDPHEEFDMLIQEAINKKHNKYELITAEECLEELENLEKTYTREEVYLVAQRSVHAVINNILTDNKDKTIKEIINSEIDTVKLF